MTTLRMSFSRRPAAALVTLLLAAPLLAYPALAEPGVDQLGGDQPGADERRSDEASTAAATVASLPDPSAIAEAVKHLRWRNIGPAVMGGRVADVAVLESNPAVFYIGTATGGVWRTRNYGTTWESIFDDQPTASIGDVTISQTNPNLIWVGSGEPQNRQSSPWGNGAYKSVDGGRTWNYMGLYETRHIARIRINPKDNDIVYVAAVGQLWGPNEERGVFRTIDGGETWEKVLYVDEDTGAIDLVMDPGDPNTLFAAIYQRRRTSFGFNGGGPGGGIYRTMDGGDSWEELTNGLPGGVKGRIGLDIYRRDGNLVFAIVEARRGQQGVYRSTDRGDSWEHLSTANNRPMYYSQIRVDPNDPERIYLGGAPLYASEDGGHNFRDDAAAGVHSDHHALWIDPNNSNYLLLAGDGGVSLSFDRAENWRQLTNVTLAQFYEIGVDMRDPYYVCGGLQDNGSWCGPSQTRSQLGIRNMDWYNVGGGDGFYVRIDPSDPSILFAESQNGNIFRVDVPTGERQTIRPVPREQGQAPDPDSDMEYRWNWNSPVIISEHDPQTIYVGSNYLLKSIDRGYTWQAISPDLTKGLDRDEMEIMGVVPQRGRTMSAHDGISTYGNLTTVSESPINPNVLYVGTDDGNLQGTRDGGASWQLLNRDMPGLPERTYVSRVVASRFDEGTVYVTFDGHDQNDYRPFVYVSSNFGEDWSAIVSGLPDDWSVNVLAGHPRNPNLLFLGNEIGVFFSIDRGDNWIHLKNNLPTVPVDDIVVHPRENDLVIGTHGRGIWIMDDITPLEELSEDLFESAAHLFAVRRAIVFNLYSPQGWTPGAWIAENPPQGAMIRYWLAEDEPVPEPERPERPARREQQDNPLAGFFPGGFGPQGEAPPEPPEPPKPTVKLTILDQAGGVVRELEGPGHAGIQQLAWNLRIDAAFVPDENMAGFGGRFGGFAMRRLRAAGRGPRVLPGTYTVRLEAAGETMESRVEVRADPRIDISRADLEARQAALMDVYHLAGPYYEAFTAVQRVRRQLGELDALLADKEAPEEVTEQLRAANEAVRELGQQLNTAARGMMATSSIQSYTARPTEDQLWQIEQAWQRVPELIGQINELVTDRMPALIGMFYQEGMGPDPGDPIAVPTRPGR